MNGDAATLELERFVPAHETINIMIRRTAIALVALLVLALTGPAVLAHEGHDHQIMGTATMAAADHVMLKDKGGKDVTVKVTKDTTVKSTPPLRVEGIKIGTRVVITATQAKDKSFTAKTIEVGVANCGKQVEGTDQRCCDEENVTLRNARTHRAVAVDVRQAASRRVRR